MKSFDETYADQDFQRQLKPAQDGWMAGIPRGQDPDFSVEGLRNSMFARVLTMLRGQGKNS